jgi:hypothetical protein
MQWLAIPWWSPFLATACLLVVTLLLQPQFVLAAAGLKWLATTFTTHYAGGMHLVCVVPIATVALATHPWAIGVGSPCTYLPWIESRQLITQWCLASGQVATHWHSGQDAPI